MKISRECVEKMVEEFLEFGSGWNFYDDETRRETAEHHAVNVVQTLLKELSKIER